MLKWLAIILTAVFVTLKVLGKLSWAWIWVLSPIWIYFLFAFLMFFVFIIVVGLFNSDRNTRKKWIK